MLSSGHLLSSSATTQLSVSSSACAGNRPSGGRIGGGGLRSTYYKERMGRQAAVALYVLALVAVVVGLDVLFFRNRFWERLMVNVGVVLVFWAFYLRFLKRP